MEAIEIIYKYGTGCSSEAIMGTHLGVSCSSDRPYDFGDLMRCIGVVKAFDINIEIMRHKSDSWNILVDNWDVLLEMCELKREKDVSNWIRKFVK
jgi:hypothetical protein